MNEKLLSNMISYSTRTGNSESHKQWLPCRAWDFESLMCPSVFCSKLFGFFPYKYKNEEYVISKMRLAIAAFLCCFHLAVQIYVLYGANYNYSDTSGTIVLTIPENFFILLDGSIPTLMFLTSYARSFMLQRVSKVSRILSPQDFNDMAKFVHTTHVLKFLFTLSVVSTYYANRQNIPLIRYCTEMGMVITSTEGLLLYLYCVYILGACFKKVNESLKRLTESPTNDQSELTELRESRRQAVKLLMKVKYYEDVHAEISDAVDHLNKSSHSVNIVFTASTFVLVTFNIYVAMQWNPNRDSLVLNIYSFYDCCSFGIYRFTQFVILIWICETAMGHAKDINTTIHDLANNCRDDTVKREVIGNRGKLYFTGLNFSFLL
ncbi:uncharacterized protein LOC143211473 [Lasioglossum baleicum]|uniref:uncharacterized protein LOC143211473 n=1 Tax=Lasioglossum baleicum TaxID=434251 RepID=UPI003FCE6B7A